MPQRAVVALLLAFLCGPSGFAQDAPTRAITIREVSFRGAQHLPKPELDNFAYSLETTSARPPDWAHAVSEKVRDFWQQHGYFRAEVKAEVRELPGSTADAATCDIVFTVSEGAQYRLGRIAFMPETHVFTETELRNFVPVADGDVLNSAKVLGGFDAIRAEYAHRGYAKFSLVPAFAFDEAQHLVFLHMQIAEGSQYRVGKVEFKGPKSSLVDDLRARFPLRSGDLFDSSLLEAFYRDNDVLLPGKCADCTTTSMDDKKGTVDVTIDLSRAVPNATAASAGN